MSSEGKDGRLRIRSWSDFLVGLVSLPVVAVLANETRHFKEVDWAPLGLAFWPRVLLAVWFVLSFILIAQSFFREGDGERLSAICFVPFILGILFLLAVPVAGMLGPLWLIAFLIGVLRRGKPTARGVLTSAVASAVIVFVVYALFGLGLGVDFPAPDFGG